MKTKITNISTGIWVLVTKTNQGIKILLPAYKTKKDAEEAKEVFLKRGIEVVVRELTRTDLIRDIEELHICGGERK